MGDFADEVLDKLDAPKKRLIEALLESKGIVSSACNAADIPRSTHYHWYNNDPEYKALVDDVNEVAIDFVEGKLYDKISTGDTIATIFYLKTRAKKRGYVERQEITGADGKPVITETHIKIIRDTGIKYPLADAPQESTDNT